MDFPSRNEDGVCSFILQPEATYFSFFHFLPSFAAFLQDYPSPTSRPYSAVHFHVLLKAQTWYKDTVRPEDQPWLQLHVLLFSELLRGNGMIWFIAVVSGPCAVAGTQWTVTVFLSRPYLPAAPWDGGSNLPFVSSRDLPWHPFTLPSHAGAARLILTYTLVCSTSGGLIQESRCDSTEGKNSSL